MATPTTAIEVSMMMENFNQNLDKFREEICRVFYVPLWRLINKKPAQPHTDDMIQMLNDLGIEPIDYTQSTFKWRL